MTARITFRSEIYISGDSIKEIREKWEAMPIFCVDALDEGAQIIEVCSVEDADTHKKIDLDADEEDEEEPL